VNVIVSYAGLGEELGILTKDRPYPLLRLAGGTIIGHVLTLVGDVLNSRLILLVEKGAEPITQLVKEAFPNVQLTMVEIEEGSGPLTAVIQCKQHIDFGETLLAFGNYLVEADYHTFVNTHADVACFTIGDADGEIENPLFVSDNGYLTAEKNATRVKLAGVLWFRQGTNLINMLEAILSRENDSLPGLSSGLVRQDREIKSQAAYNCLDTRSTVDLLHANARLLGLGYGSEDAIERSYAEDFTALPPVFIHESAVIENSVIGPFANIERAAVIRGSIVRNSLVGVETQVEDTILDSSIIGDRVRIKGHTSSLIVGEASHLEIKYKPEEETE
jgi:glucose-1-phosphate thymidylyltransferase